MASATPQFDAKRLAKLMALVDSSSDGEAQSAFMQTRLMLHKAGLRLVDALETDAYAEAITRQVKPGCSRSGNTAELQRLREACRTFAEQRDALQQTGQAMLQDLQQLEQEYNALVEQHNALVEDHDALMVRCAAAERYAQAQQRPFAAARVPGGVKSMIGLLILSLVFGGAQWWTTPVPPTPGIVHIQVKKPNPIKRQRPSRVEQRPDTSPMTETEREAVTKKLRQ